MSKTYSFTLFSKTYPYVCQFGNGDLMIMRNRTGTCQRNNFEYYGVVHPFVPVGDDNIGKFTIKRIRIFRFG